MSLTYPPFACGSAYVVGRSLVAFLSDNRERLHAFQGEDVSLAIWLSGLQPRRVIDSRFLCSRSSITGSRAGDFISVPDLTPQQLQSLWRHNNSNNELMKT